jgi:hypothetical protein
VASTKITAFWDMALCNVVSSKQTDVSEIGLIALMMKAVRTSEMSVHFNETRQCYIPEGCDLLTMFLTFQTNYCVLSDHNFK